MHSDHGAHDSGSTHIIDEKSIQDKLLAVLAVMVLIGLLALGCYWQSLPLAAVQVEEESSKK
jgi:1,4-dihydroxy-2-naphthoate octaprenyltransferase